MKFSEFREGLRPIWSDPLWLFVIPLAALGFGFFYFYEAPVATPEVDWGEQGIRITVIRNDGYCTEIVPDKADSHLDTTLAILAENGAGLPVLVEEISLEGYLPTDASKSQNQLAAGEDSTYRVDMTLSQNSLVESCIYQPALAEDQPAVGELVYVAKVSRARWLQPATEE